MKNIDLKLLHPKIIKKMESLDAIFGEMTEEMEIEIFSPGDAIVHFNQPITKLRYLVDGKAKITLVHENGKQSIVHFIRPNAYIGELTFLEIEKQHKNVIAISDCVFVSIPLDQAKERLMEDSAFLLRLGQHIGAKMLKVTGFYSKNQSYALRNRLAAYIIAFEHSGFYREKHTETAEFLGVSYRHLLHTFHEFVEESFIKKCKGGYMVEVDALKELAKDIEIE